jgi:hypothetical protein
MAREPYALLIGRTLLDLYALEHALRRFLENVDTSISAAEELPSLTIGETLPSDVATNQDSLGILIDKFNKSVVASNHAELAIDNGVADAAAVLTTGRIWGENSETPVHLVQFSMPTYGLVRCTSNQLVDHGWLEAQALRLKAALANVVDAGRRVQPDRWAPGPQAKESASAA